MHSGRLHTYPRLKLSPNRRRHLSGRAYTVITENIQYNPPELRVHRGDRIVWVNKDLVPPYGDAASLAFDSQSIAANASWIYVASKAGEYAYGCPFHPTMKEILKVQ
jgi:plastocyanin